MVTVTESDDGTADETSTNTIDFTPTTVADTLFKALLKNSAIPDGVVINTEDVRYIGSEGQAAGKNQSEIPVPAGTFSNFPTIAGIVPLQDGILPYQR